VQGGYDANCQKKTTNKTTLDGQGMIFSDSIIEITDNIGGQNVTLIDLIVRHGQDDSDYGGGIEISGFASNSTTVNLQGVIAENNESARGGGIHVTHAELNMQDATLLYGNNALESGGGVYCENSTIVMGGNTYVGFLTGNTATSNVIAGNGGGFYLDNCDLVLDATNGQTGAYILGNEAKRGGGIYATNNSRIDMHGDMSWVNLNSAQRGGGLYLNMGSDFFGDNGSIKDNDASLFGGGFYLAGSGTNFDMDRNNEYPCSGKCSELSGNESPQGGAGYLEAQTNADIESSWIEGNAASQKGLAFKSNGSLSIKSSMITGQRSMGSAASVFDISDGLTTLSHCTISDSELNTTVNAPIFFLNISPLAELNLNNSIVWGNDADYSSLVVKTDNQTTSIENNILEFSTSGTNQTVDPQFLVPGSDFHISPDSPAVDAAAITTVVDVDKEQRDLGNGTDIGADEAYLRVGVAGQVCQFSNITEAVAAANSGDTIYISPGNYIERPGLVDKSLTFVPAEQACTQEKLDADSQTVIIDGNRQFVNQGGVFVVGGASNVTFRHMTLKNGRADSGGVLYVDISSAVTLDDVDITGGVAQDQGGGIRIRSGGSVVLNNGSAVYSNFAQVIVKNTLSANHQRGGGVAIGDSGVLTLNDNSFIGGFGAGNTAVGDGGGIYVQGGVVNLNDTSAVIVNDASNGGGIYANSLAIIRLNDQSFVGVSGGGNSAGIRGGGIYLGNESQLSISGNAAINDNSANYGGGVYSEQNCTITSMGGEIKENDATNNGGGILAVSGSGETISVDLTNTNVSGNTANYGAGIQASISGGGDLVLKGVTVANNSAGERGGGILVGGNNPLDSFILDQTIVSGNTSQQDGAGVSMSTATHLIARNGTEFRQNIAALNGGGLFSESDNAQFEIIDSSLINNQATNGSGGAIYLTGLSNTLTLTSLGTDTMLIAGNFALTGNGGAVYASGLTGGISSNLQIRPLFTNNRADGNGGGAVYVSNSTQAVTFAGIDFGLNSGGANTALSGVGGAIWFDNVSDAKLVNLSVQNNQADLGGGLAIEGSDVFVGAYMQNIGYPGGGAVYASPCIPSSISANRYCSEFIANSASTGADAIYLGVGGQLNMEHTLVRGHAFAAIKASFGTNVTVRNSLFEQNAGLAVLWLAGISTDFTIEQSTFAGNTATQTINQGLSEGVTGRIDNSILWGNSHPSSFTIAVSGGCNVAQSVDVPGISVDPQFVETDRGRYRLGASSPAVDACTTEAGYDLDDGLRPIDGNNNNSSSENDMGAFEYAGPPDVTLTVELTGTGHGVVSSSPAGLSCSANICEGSFPQGTAVVLTAAPGNGSVFTQWVGSCSASGNQCTLTVNQNEQLGVVFTNPDVLFSDSFE
ncbi:MAG: beta strand repeat-containing protein, partial [bacterium]